MRGPSYRHHQQSSQAVTPFGANHSRYGLLAAARTRAGNVAGAWAALEADMARGLLDEMATRRGIGLSGAEQRQRDEWHAQRTTLDARVLALGGKSKRT